MLRRAVAHFSQNDIDKLAATLNRRLAILYIQFDLLDGGLIFDMLL